MIHIMSDNTTSELTDVQEEDVQPNAVDLRLDKVFQILPNVFVIGEEGGKEQRLIEVLQRLLQTAMGTTILLQAFTKS